MVCLIFTAVKWLTTILALYVLCLSLWPCADDHVPLDGQKDQITLTSTGVPQSNDSHDHSDHCSPLCTCSCCSATITLVPCYECGLIPALNPVVGSVAAFVYTPVRWAEPLSAIWQPPKLRV